jgi:flagellar protein FlaG
MIENMSVNENLAINQGEGVSPSRPPSSSEVNAATKTGGPGQTNKTAESPAVELSREIKGNLEQAEVKQKEAEKELVEQELKDTVRRLNEKLARLDREILLKVDQRIDKNYVSVIDKESKEVIREFPPEAIRTFIARFMEFNEKLASTTDLRSLILNLEV